MEKEIIKKVELDLNGKKVTLTMKQMKLLKEAFDDMFGKQVIYEYRDPWHHVPYWYYQPQYWYSSGTAVEYTSNTGTLSLKVG